MEKGNRMETQFNVRGQVALITGGTGVLGGAMAAGLARAGARVVIGSRSLERAEQAAEALASSGGKAMGVQMNVADRSSVEDACAAIRKQWGRMDILVNAAGGNISEATATDDLSFFDLPQEALSEVMKLNLLGTIIPSQVFGRQMAEQKEGTIIHLSSVAATRPLTRVVGYAASKSAAENFTAWLAVYMAKNASPTIRVNAITPGFFETEQNRFLLRMDDGGLSPRGQQIIDHTPMDRFGEPGELLGALLWLASPASQFVTGIVVPVDGGFLAFGGV
jgi:NAD(P)-dependent dehydrogenase (short-subunit alcohol dehydrogenase family)